MNLTIITQLAGEKPKILLVGGGSKLVVEVSRYFERHDFVVKQREPGSFLSNLPFGDDYYQVIFLIGFEENPGDYSASLDHFAKLLSSKDLVLPKLLLICPSWSFWSDYDTEVVGKLETVINLALTNHPNSRLIIGLDVLTGVGGIMPPLKMMTAKYSSGEVVDPNLQLSPISLKRFGFLLKGVLKNPGESEVVIIGGQTQSTKQVAGEIRRSALSMGHKVVVGKGVALSKSGNHALAEVIRKIKNHSHLKTGDLEPESLPDLIGQVVGSLSKPVVGASDSQNIFREIGLPKPSRPKTQGNISPKSVSTNQNLANQNLTSQALNTQSFPRQSIASHPPTNRPPTTHSPTSVAINTSPPQATSPKTTIDLNSSSVVGSTKSTTKTPVPPNTNSNSSPTKINEPQSKVDEKISTLFSLQRLSNKTDHLVDLHQKTKKVKQKNKKRRFSFVFGSAMVVMGVVAIGLLIGFWFSTNLLKQELMAVTTSGPNPLLEARDSKDSLARRASLVDRQIGLYSQFIPDSFFLDASLLVRIAEEMVILVEDLRSFDVSRQSLVLQSVGAPYSPAPTLSVGDVERLYERVSLLSASISEYARDQSFSGDNEDLTQLIDEIDSRRRSLSTYQQLLAILSELLGGSGRRSYALVFQNEQELRPTGGFIQAVAILTFDNSMLVDSQVFSSYQLDNRLAAIIEPPADLARVLGEERFYLRDANWNPDFEVSASQIAWFIEETLGRKVSGVIGINNSVMQNLLRAVGPLELAAYDEVLTDRNLMERMEYHSEVDLIESAEIRDYSVVVLSSFLQKLSNLDQDRALPFLAALGQSLSQKNLLISLFDQDESAILAGLGWTGALLSPGCPSQLAAATCLVESLAVVDANVGINKANYYLKRQQRHSAQLEGRSILHSHTITLTNEATTNAWPKGSYSSYLRFFIPSQSTFEEVVVNDQKIDLDDLIITQSGDLKIIGVKTITPISSQTNISFRYRTPLLPEQLESREWSYALFVQKQPGVDQALGAISLNYPSSLTPTLIAPQAGVDLDGITYTNFANEHIFVGASFARR